MKQIILGEQARQKAAKSCFCEAKSNKNRQKLRSAGSEGMARLLHESIAMKVMESVSCSCLSSDWVGFSKTKFRERGAREWRGPKICDSFRSFGEGK